MIHPYRPMYVGSKSPCMYACAAYLASIHGFRVASDNTSNHDTSTLVKGRACILVLDIYIAQLLNLATSLSSIS